MLTSKELTASHETEIQKRLAAAEKKVLLYETILNNLDISVQLHEHQDAPAYRTLRSLGARYTFADILGTSMLLKAVQTKANRAARTSSNILIYGETGTGKELFAQSIHNTSPRKENSFFAINCASLAEHRLEELLFGAIKKGSAHGTEQSGFFERAQGGTLLLDDLHTMDITLQAKLLRTLQEQPLCRVGTTDEITINVRIITTMNINPFEAIARKQLREDLFYLLGAVTLHIPPLREHKEDIPVYIDSFLKKYNQSMGLKVQRVAAPVLDVFQQYSWPGNIRELQHAIEGAMNLVVAESEIQMHHLPSLLLSNLLSLSSSKPSGIMDASDTKKLIEQRNSMEKKLICVAFNKSNGNITRAAKSLGLTRQLLQYKLKKYHLK